MSWALQWRAEILLERYGIMLSKAWVEHPIWDYPVLFFLQNEVSHNYSEAWGIKKLYCISETEKHGVLSNTFIMEPI